MVLIKNGKCKAFVFFLTGFERINFNPDKPPFFRAGHLLIIRKVMISTIIQRE